MSGQLQDIKAGSESGQTCPNKDKVTNERHEVENHAGKAEACGTCKSNGGLEGA